MARPGAVWQVPLKLICFQATTHSVPTPPKPLMPMGHPDPCREKPEVTKTCCGLWSLGYFGSQQQRVELSRPYRQPGLSPTATRQLQV